MFSCVICCVVLCCAMLCCAMLRYASLRYVLLCHAMPCHVMLCYGMLYCVLSCDIMSCYGMLCDVVFLFFYTLVCQSFIPCYVVLFRYAMSNRAMSRYDMCGMLVYGM